MQHGASQDCNPRSSTGIFSFIAVAERSKSMERRGRKSRRRRRRRTGGGEWRRRGLAHHRTKTLSRRAAEQSKRKGGGSGAFPRWRHGTDGRRRNAPPHAVTKLSAESGSRATHRWRWRWRRRRRRREGGRRRRRIFLHLKINASSAATWDKFRQNLARRSEERESAASGRRRACAKPCVTLG